MTSDTVDTATLGNTKSKVRAKNWIITWNNYSESDWVDMEAWMKKECEKYALQEETGENGTKHLQGCFSFKNARYFDSLKKTWPKIHLEKSRSWDACVDYCTKAETRTGRSVNNCVRKVKDPLEDKELRPIQVELIEILKPEPDDRTIHWVFDKEGGAGKTTLAKHLCLKYPNEVLYLTGKAADMKYGVTKHLEKNDLKIVLIDLTRSIENFVSYEGIEAIKNGIFYNTKYESGMVVFNCPHVVIFANFEPELGKLSADRWNIIEI